MLKVKLSPRGKKHQISYRIVIAESKSKLRGKYVDNLGFYTPQTKTLKIDQDKLKSWQKKGAQVTLGLDKLLNPDKYPKKTKKRKKKKDQDTQTSPKLKANKDNKKEDQPKKKESQKKETDNKD